MSNGVMIDWITAQIEATSDGVSGGGFKPHLFDTGRFMKLDSAGTVLENFSSRYISPGSFDSSLTYRAPYPHVLEMSGNPVKFFQGHNLFGSADRLGLFLEAGLASNVISDHFLEDPDPHTNRFPNPDMWEQFEFLRPKFTRLDLTRSYRFSDNARAREWIRGCAASARTKHKAGLRREGTVYFGQASTRWAFKIYHKFDEINSGIKGHRLSDRFTAAEVKALTAWSEGIVRFELTLRTPEIKKLAYDFTPSDVWDSYFSKISFNDNERLFLMDDLEALVDLDGKSMPGHLKMAVIAWRAGNDLRTIYSHNQYYRNLKALRAWGFDVSVPIIKADVNYFDSVLNSESWNPEPIKEFFHHTSQELPLAFGL